MQKGFEILDNNNSRDDLLSYREKGALRGVYLGYPYLDEHYTMSLPGCTDWTGFPMSGKSEFLLELLFNTSLFYGWKHLLYVPDIGDKNEVLAILIHKASGKSFDKTKDNYISEQEVDKELLWILEHFKIITKVDLRAKISPYEFWHLAEKIKSETIGGIQTATIDSWKDMKLDVGMDGNGFGRDDKFLDDVLSYRNAMSEHLKMHFHLVVHPIKTEKTADGKRKPPTPYDQKGGGTWFDNGKCMATAHRVDGTYNAVDIIFNKIKPKSVGKVGTVRMYFDEKIARFYWDNGGQKVYAEKIKVTPKALLLSKEQEIFGDKNDDGDDIPF